MPLLHLPDAAIHYRCYGSGEPLLLIHGLGSSGDDWAFQIDALAARHRLIVPDLRGSGASIASPDTFSVERFAQDLWRLLDHLGVARPRIAGFSLGGAVALEMALQQERVERLVLINSLPTYRVDHWRKWLELNLQIATVTLLGLPRTAALVGRRLFPHPHQAPMRDRVAAVIGTRDPGPYLRTARALAAWCAAERVATLRAPTLMIAGEHDYTPLAEKHLWAERLGAQIAVVRDSRHGTPFDAVHATNACIDAFVSGTPLPESELLRIDDAARAPREPPVLARWECA